jgi:hypothetical protein
LKATPRLLPPTQAKSGQAPDYAKTSVRDGGYVANFMPRLLYAREKPPPPYVLNIWRDGPPNPNKSFRGGGKYVAGPGNWNKIHRLSSPQLYRLRYKATAERMTRNYITCSFIREKIALLFYFRASAYIARDFGAAGIENSFLYFQHAVCIGKTRKFLPQNSTRSFENKTTL